MENKKRMTTQASGWVSAFKAFLDRRALIMLFLGFSAGIPILLILSYHNGKAFVTEFADRNICILGENRHRVGSDAHPTSENGKIAAFASGRPAFQKHAKHAEGSDTIPTAHVQKALSAGRISRNLDRSKKVTQPSGAATPAEQRRA